MADTLPEPASRKEEFLAKAAGMSGVELPTPASREELYLNAIANGGGGGGGGGEGYEGIKILTEDDYEERSGIYSVHLWNLDDGIYYAPTGIKVSMANARHFDGENSLFLIKKETTFTRVTRYGGSSFSASSNEIYTGIIQTETALNHSQYEDGHEIYVYDALTSASLVQNLTTDSALKPLAAGQGKVLKNLIDSLVIKNQGAPTTATAGTVGMLLEDTTNGKLYICTAVTPGTDPDPDTYTWSEVGGGGGGDTVYSTKTTSNSNTGGAVYIGNLGTDQTEVADPSPNDNHYKYFWALPSSNNGNSYGQPGDGTVNIMGSAKGAGSVTIGLSAGSGSYGAQNMVAIGNEANSGHSGVAIGYQSGSTQDFTGNVCIGDNAKISSIGVNNAIALGRYAFPTRAGELNIGTGSQPTAGFNSSNYRVIGGVYDGQQLHDAATVAQGNTLASSAPTTSTVGVLGQLYTDTTNMQTYQCTAINGNTYTWTAFGGGGGGGSSVTTYYVDPAFTFDETPQSVSLYKDDALTTTATGAEIYDALIAGGVRIAQVDFQNQRDYMEVLTYRMPVTNTDADFTYTGGIIIETPSGADNTGFHTIYIIADRTANSIECFYRAVPS